MSWYVGLYDDENMETVKVLATCEDEDWARAIADSLEPKVYEGYHAGAFQDDE